MPSIRLGMPNVTDAGPSSALSRHVSPDGRENEKQTGRRRTGPHGEQRSLGVSSPPIAAEAIFADPLAQDFRHEDVLAAAGGIKPVAFLPRLRGGAASNP